MILIRVIYLSRYGILSSFSSTSVKFGITMEMKLQFTLNGWISSKSGYGCQPSVRYSCFWATSLFGILKHRQLRDCFQSLWRSGALSSWCFGVGALKDSIFFGTIMWLAMMQKIYANSSKANKKLTLSQINSTLSFLFNRDYHFMLKVS